MTKMTRRDFLRGGAGAAATLFLLKVPVVEGGVRKTKSYAFIVDTTRCIGCGNCVRACAAENDVPEGVYRTWIERYTVSRSGDVAVESPEGGKEGFGPPPVEEQEVGKSFFVPKLCNHCSNPPCVQVCPIGATFKTKDGVILVDSEHCMGCGYCVQSCPYAARFMNEGSHTADKCTWCYHRITRGKAPACVAICPVGARRFGEEEGEIGKTISEGRMNVLKGDLGTEPKVHYVGLSSEVV